MHERGWGFSSSQNRGKFRNSKVCLVFKFGFRKQQYLYADNINVYFLKGNVKLEADKFVYNDTAKKRPFLIGVVILKFCLLYT
jgi:hypothetical protein